MSGNSISVFIPCIPMHFGFAMNAVKAYCEQGVEEIVVGLSQAIEVPIGERHPSNGMWSDHIRLVEINRPLGPGPCRNLAAMECRGDIIAYHDADDMPYPNRIERVREVFKSKDMMMLNHGFMYHNEQPGGYTHSGELVSMAPEYDYYFPDGKIDGIEKRIGCYADRPNKTQLRCVLGPVVIRREVLSQVKWKGSRSLDHFEWGEDLEFCVETFWKFNKSYILDAPLYTYIKRLHGRF